MANVVGTNIAGIGNDFEPGDLSALATYTAGTQTATSFTMVTPGDPDGGLTFNGTGFGAYSGNHPTTGTITEIHIRNGAFGVFEANWTGLSISVATFNTWVSTDDITAFANAAFGGADTITGTDFGDHLVGYGGNDTITPGLRLDPLSPDSDIVSGGDGNDTIVAQGALAGDNFNGDAGTDTLVITPGPLDVNPDDDTLGFHVSDFASATLNGFEAMTYAGNGLPTWASFSSSEIGTGFSATTAVNGGAGAPTSNVLYVSMDTATIDMSGWTFTNWQSIPDLLAINQISDLMTNGYDAVAIQGGNAANTITGTSQTDLINGDGADDVGVEMADTIHGGAGNDEIDGWGGADQVFGDAGNDVLQAYTGEVVAGERFDGGADTDALEVNGQVDFQATTIVSIEALKFRPDENQVTPLAPQASFSSTQLGGGALSATLSVTGSALADFVNIYAATATSAIDVSGWTFNTWTANVDFVELFGGAGANVITGTSQGDQIDGGAGADTLFGGAGGDQFFGVQGGDGADEMHGGTGDDRYGVFDTGDVVVENAGEGSDTINAWVNYTLSANVESGQLQGTATSLTGNTQANFLFGTDGANTLDGGLGADSMWGAGGNDTYSIDNVGDVVNENSGEGTDTIRSTIGVSALAANVENLELLGTVATGNGNELNNRITGNASNNNINGGAGADTMIGGQGNDTYSVDNAGDVVTEGAGAGSGTDTINSTIDITSTLAANVENLNLNGAITGTGNGLNNVINGNSLNNTLNGASGEDTLNGGLGNDLYIVNSVGDVVNDTGGNADNITSFIDMASLNASIENLTLAGTALIGGGNGLDNIIVGNNLANTLTGGLGNDQLNGGVGADTMAGGAGDDSYLVENAGDVVDEDPGDGSDTVYAFITLSALAVNVEKLNLMPAGGAINGTANGLDNRLNGNDFDNVLTALGGNDVIQGLGGNDHIIGGAGQDNIFGGAGNDVFVYQATSDSGVTGATRDLINDFVQGADHIDLFAIDAITGGSDNSFTFLGTNAFTHTAGELRYDLIDAVGTANDFTVIGIDVNGDAVADMQLTLKGLYTLAGSDFVL